MFRIKITKSDPISCYNVFLLFSFWNFLTLNKRNKNYEKDFPAHRSLQLSTIDVSI